MDSKKDQQIVLQWANILLEARDLVAQDLGTAWSDGVLFINLIEVAFNEKLKDYHKRPASGPMNSLRAMENVVIAFRVLQKFEVLMTGLAPTDLVSGKEKRVFNVLWRVYEHCAVTNRRSSLPARSPPSPSSSATQNADAPKGRESPDFKKRNSKAIRGARSRYLTDRPPPRNLISIQAVPRHHASTGQFTRRRHGSMDRSFAVAPLQQPIPNFLMLSPEVSPVGPLSPIQLTPTSPSGTRPHAPALGKAKPSSAPPSPKEQKTSEMIDDESGVISMKGFQVSKEVQEALRKQQEEKAERDRQERIRLRKEMKRLYAEQAQAAAQNPAPKASSSSNRPPSKSRGGGHMEKLRAATRGDYAALEAELFGGGATGAPPDTTAAGGGDSDSDSDDEDSLAMTNKALMKQERSAARGRYEDMEAELFGGGAQTVEVPGSVSARSNDPSSVASGSSVDSDIAAMGGLRVQPRQDADRTAMRSRYQDVEAELFGASTDVVDVPAGGRAGAHARDLSIDSDDSDVAAMRAASQVPPPAAAADALPVPPLPPPPPPQPSGSPPSLPASPPQAIGNHNRMSFSTEVQVGSRTTARLLRIMSKTIDPGQLPIIPLSPETSQPNSPGVNTQYLHGDSSLDTRLSISAARGAVLHQDIDEEPEPASKPRSDPRHNSILMAKVSDFKLPTKAEWEASLRDRTGHSIKKAQAMLSGKKKRDKVLDRLGVEAAELKRFHNQPKAYQRLGVFSEQQQQQQPSTRGPSTSTFGFLRKGIPWFKGASVKGSVRQQDDLDDLSADQLREKLRALRADMEASKNHVRILQSQNKQKDNKIAELSRAASIPFATTPAVRALARSMSSGGLTRPAAQDAAAAMANPGSDLGSFAPQYVNRALRAAVREYTGRAGYLFKRRPMNRIFSKWVKRYFVLKGANLVYYASPTTKNEPKAKGSINLAEFSPPTIVQEDEKDQDTVVMHFTPKTTVSPSIELNPSTSARAGTPVDIKSATSNRDTRLWLAEINDRLALMEYLDEADLHEELACAAVVNFLITPEKESLIIRHCDDTVLSKALRHFKIQLQQRPKFRQITMCDCDASDKTASILCEILMASHTIQRVDLSGNQLSDASASVLADTLHVNSTIRYICLDHNNITDQGIGTLSAAIPQHRGLSHLSFASNSISGQGVGMMLAPFIDDPNRKLPVVSLGNNTIGDQGMAVICQLLTRNTSVECLLLASCGITDEGALSLASVLQAGNCPNLKELDLGGNLITHKGLEALMESIQTSGPFRFRLGEAHLTPDALAVLSRTTRPLYFAQCEIVQDDVVAPSS